MSGHGDFHRWSILQKKVGFTRRKYQCLVLKYLSFWFLAYKLAKVLIVLCSLLIVLPSLLCYTYLMDVIVEFNEAAFRHNITKEDILNALKSKIYAAAIEGLSEKYAVIGFDLAGNPLEIMYNLINDNTIKVFHAMKVRRSFIKMLGL